MLVFAAKTSRFTTFLFQQTSQQVRRLPAAWKAALTAFLAGRIFFSAWAAVIWKMDLIPDYQGPYYFNITPLLDGLPGALLGMWQRWDAIHYQRIVMYGYEDAGLTAFFPLYPLLARALSTVTGLEPLPALIVVSNLALLLALAALFRLVEQLHSQGTAGKTLFKLLIYPAAFFLFAVYPQSLLLLWTVLAYSLVRQGRWRLASLASFLAGLTHPTAAALTALLGVEALAALRRKEKDRFFVVLAPLANLAAAGMFLEWRRLAGFSGYVDVQTAVGSRSLHLPWQGLSAAWQYVWALPFNLAHSLEWVNLLVFLLVAGLLGLSLRRLPLAMSFYLLAMLSILFSSYSDQNPLLGIVRYPVVMFPLFIWLAQQRLSKGWQLAWFVLMVALALVCSAAFLMWKGVIL